MARITGRRGAIPQPRETGSIDRFGLATLTRFQKIEYARMFALMPSPGSLHPVFRTMGLSKVTWNRSDGGAFVDASLLYEGFIGRLPEPTYELTLDTSEDPIATHQQFVEQLGGTADAPLNDAIFDEQTGAFVDFAATSDLAGVRSFLQGGATWTETAFSITRPVNLGDVGRISNPAGNPPTTIGGSRNWLLLGAGYTRRGFIFQSRRVWKLSGRGGWNPLIYGS